MAAPVTGKFDEDPIKIEGTIDRTRSNKGFFATQEQVTPKWMGRSGWNSNSSKILWPSWLPVRLMKIRKKASSYHPDNMFSIISLWENSSSLKGE